MQIEYGAVRRMKYLYRIALLTMLLSLPALGCFMGHPEPYFPPHRICYEPGWLNVEGDIMRVRILEDISMRGYPHLKLRQGFTLKRAIVELSGGDGIGHVVAVADNSSRGFAIETMDSNQGKFLFAPLTTTDAMLEYVEFMYHEPPVSEYEREHRYILSQADYDNTLAHFEKYTIHAAPPVNFTRITATDSGHYLVELVYSSELYVHRVTYASFNVTREGDIEFIDSYNFVEGPPGAVL